MKSSYGKWEVRDRRAACARDPHRRAVVGPEASEQQRCQDCRHRAPCVDLLTRHGIVPGALDLMESGTKSSTTKLCHKSQANAAVRARGARAALLLQVHKYLCPVGLLPMGSNTSIFLLGTGAK